MESIQHLNTRKRNYDDTPHIVDSYIVNNLLTNELNDTSIIIPSTNGDTINKKTKKDSLPTLFNMDIHSNHIYQMNNRKECIIENNLNKMNRKIDIILHHMDTLSKKINILDYKLDNILQKNDNDDNYRKDECDDIQDLAVDTINLNSDNENVLGINMRESDSTTKNDNSDIIDYQLYYIN